MKNISWLVLWLVLSAATAQNLTPQDLTPQDFAAGMSIDTASEDSLQVLELSAPVYDTLTRTDLGDLHVFNAAGEVLPYAFVEENIPVTREELELPLYRLASETLSDSLSVQIEQGAVGTSVQVDTNAAPSSDELYIVDQRNLTSAAQLRFEWENWEGVSDVRLETSADLERWRPAENFTLAQLESGGFSLVKNALIMPNSNTPSAAYLRLRPSPGETLPPLSNVYAEVSSRGERSGREQRVQGQALDTGYLYDLGGAQRVMRVALDTGENALARVRLESADTLDGPWTTRFEGVYFDLMQRGQRVARGPLELGEARARYWRLSADPVSGLGPAPTLTFTLLADRLAFLQRGAEPFTLAYGSYLAPSAAEPSLLAGSALKTALATSDLATLSAPFELGGESALVPPPPPFDWQPYVLWAVLLIGVGGLSVLALQLLRMNNASQD